MEQKVYWSIALKVFWSIAKYLPGKCMNLCIINPQKDVIASVSKMGYYHFPKLFSNFYVKSDILVSFNLHFISSDALLFWKLYLHPLGSFAFTGDLPELVVWITVSQH